MPTVQCRCKTCGHAFAHLTFKGDDSPPVCPRCKATDIYVNTDQPGFMTGTGLGSLIAGVPKGPS